MPEREVVEGLAARLKAVREAAGLSQTEAGERSGVHHISIARFETDKRVPTLAILYKLAEAYGANVCDLLPGGQPTAATSTTSPDGGKVKNSGSKRGRK